MTTTSTDRGAAGTMPRPPGANPQWRALLEARWQARLRELTELSLAYHAADAPGRRDGTGPQDTAALLRRAVGARRRLADVEEALARLAAGRFGRCEQCGSAVPAGLLAVSPEARYCPHCHDGTARAQAAPERAAGR